MKTKVLLASAAVIGSLQGAAQADIVHRMTSSIQPTLLPHNYFGNKSGVAICITPCKIQPSSMYRPV